MKRPIKPFVVEVRKGNKNQQKKTPVTDLLPIMSLAEKPQEDSALKRAGAALFKTAPKPDEAEPTGRSGRILESIPVGTEPVAEPVVETRRRGRPPGSRNKPRAFEAEKPEAAAVPKRRGRPPKVLEGSVRKVQLTPELASAALESIAKARVTRPIAPIISAQKEASALPRVKPKRTPRAALPAGDPPVSKRAKKKAPAPALAAPRPKTQQSPPAQPASPPSAVKPHPTLDRLPRLLRMAAEMGRSDPEALFAALQRPRAGERWRRRLRGVAFFAYERRQRKSITTPR